MNGIPKPWSAKYVKEALAEEAALAAIHPAWRHVSGKRSGGLISGGQARQTPSLQQSMCPHWRSSKEAAGALAIELGLEIRYDTDEGTVTVSPAGQRRGTTENFAAHPDRDAAIMAAIVRAAIQMITEARES